MIATAHEQAQDDKADVGAEQESDRERSGDDAPMTLPEHQQPSLSSAADTRPNRVGPTASMAIPYLSFKVLRG